MKLVYSNAFEMAHIWANSGFKTYGFVGGRASANNNKFFSYSTLIGIVDEFGTLIMSRYRYSNTTNRHQQALRDSFKYRKILEFESSISDRYYDTPKLLEKEKEYRIMLIDNLIKKQSTARTANYESDIKYHFNKLSEIFEYFKTPLDYELPDISDKISKLKESKKQEKLELKQINIKEFEDKFLNLWRLGKTKYDAIRQILDDGDFTKVQQTYINNRLQFFFSDWDYIRITGDRIETNRNAYVSTSDAKLLLRCLESHRDCVGMKLGNYTVIRNSDDMIQIGCHKFKISDNIQVLREIN